VSDLVVAERHRRRGIGRRLLAASERFAVESGASSLELVVYEFNESALRFYQRLGFGTLSRSLAKPLV
jgi:ribosomal protein S18 acetylase RimI-like enzyme